MLIIHNFIVFEGGDGSGTSTQIDLLKKHFLSRNSESGESGGAAGGLAAGNAGDTAGVWGLPPLHTTFEPTDGPIGRLIRSALRGDISLEAETIARLFAADRNEHLSGKNGIPERCRRGELVVSDRYTPSSLVYQGIECGEALPKLLNGTFPGPELLLYFDLDSETALERIKTRPSRDIYERLEFQRKVRNAYKSILSWYAGEGVRVRIIDASRAPKEVAEEVWSAVQELPIMRNRERPGE
ncbi:MAG: dTMP kinase [Spirochaetaceae bacterium]|jgi:dTMP kinase|nr:dTMP kinase [Spirochaetaceae bacterium]